MTPRSATGETGHPILRGIKDGEIWATTDVYGVRLPPPGDSKPLVFGEVVEDMAPTGKPVKGKENDPMMPIAWIKTFTGESGKPARVFTTTHGKFYFPGPLHAMDELLPGRTCKRDLIGEIADALSKRNIRLMLYFHPGPGPSEDQDWSRVAGINPLDDQKNIRVMLSMYREIGERYETASCIAGRRAHS